MSQDYSQIVLDQTDKLFHQLINKDTLVLASRSEWPAALWAAMANAGLPFAMVPEEDGGVGLAWSDVAALIRLMGYHALPLPLPETILGNWLWHNVGGRPLEGPVTLAFGCADVPISIEKGGGSCILSGVAYNVPWAGEARHLLVSGIGSDGGAYLCLLHDERGRVTLRRNVAYEPRQILDLSGVQISASNVRPLSERFGERAIQRLVAAMRSQQMIGAMERCLQYALAYANERVQFGRPIAKFQAIQQMLAVAAGQFAAAVAAGDALSEMTAPDEDLFTVALAKARCSEAVGPVASICHQVHGAMGFTQEHPLHLFTRRLWAWRDEGGTEASWQEWIGRYVALQGADELWPVIVSPRTHLAR